MPLHRALPLVLLVGGCAHAPGVATPAPAAGPYDVVIAGGRVVDGTGNPWYSGALATKGDRIARLPPPGLLARAGGWWTARGIPGTTGTSPSKATVSPASRRRACSPGRARRATSTRGGWWWRRDSSTSRRNRVRPCSRATVAW